MAITVEERHQSPSGSYNGINITYLVGGTADESAARTAVLDTAPLRYTSPYGVLRRQDRDVQVREVWVPGDDEGSYWEYSVPYGPREAETGDRRFEFTIGGGTDHIFNSKECVAAYAGVGYTAATTDHDTAINISQDGEVMGVDLNFSAPYVWSETHYLPYATVTDAYRDIIAGCVKHTNNAAFRGGDAGEIMLVQVTGSNRGRTDWALTFQFAQRKADSNITIGTISGISKAGWDLADPYWAEVPLDPATVGAARRGKRLRAIYIHRVFDAADYSTLGIGTDAWDELP